MSAGNLTDDQKERIATALDTVPFARLLGLKLVSIESGCATLSLDIKDELTQNHGVVHGGAIASLIDSATAFAIISQLAEGERTTTVDLTIHYLRPLVRGVITAKARVLRAGRRIIVTEADVFDSGGNLAATALSSYLRLTASTS